METDINIFLASAMLFLGKVFKNLQGNCSYSEG